MSDYSNGGYIPGGPTVVRIDPDECILNIHGVCIRSDHPTPTSDGTKPGAWWICEGPIPPDDAP
jgi:hypothetical protein